MRLLDKFAEWWENFYYIRTLKENIVYRNSDNKIAVFFSTEENIFRVFIHDTVFQLPLQDPLKKHLNKEESPNTFLTDSLKDLPIPQLEEILKDYEELEYYDKCSEIRDLIQSKLKNNEN